ncbi:hypothetical protein NQ317_018005 [Molorchus minor]|uniref:Endonuclease/exonuclease/phosphatase domain-containing protein n=1 Tax=Molorchus minor TaxID=1323400 RepID=A0ABQ9JRY5_9CUCU|nr:hypothetical protein NQ317_018005 [Molorchus minor]
MEHEQKQWAQDQETMALLRQEIAASRAAAQTPPAVKIRPAETAEPPAKKPRKKPRTAEKSAETRGIHREKPKNRRKTEKRPKLDSPTSSSESESEMEIEARSKNQQPANQPRRLRQKRGSPPYAQAARGRQQTNQPKPPTQGPAQNSPPVPHQPDDPDGRDDGQDAGDVRDDGSTVREAPVDSIRILSWNVNGFRSRRNELLEIADRLEPDVIAIQETKMDSRHEFRMRGYRVYRQDRNIRGGGVAVLVRSNITHHQTRAGGLGNLEAIGIEIQLPRREPLHILSCYQPPNVPLLGEDLGDLFPDAQQVIAIGDFNAKSQQWNSRRLNARGRELEGFLDAHPEIQPIGPPEPTQQSANNISDVLDIALAGNIPYDLSIANHREGSSDHDPILLTVWGTHTDNTIHTRKITDWGAFRAHLQTHIHDITLIHNTEELDLAVLNLETDIKTSLVHSTVERQEPRREKCLGQISEEAMDLIRARRAAKKRAWRTRDPADRRVYNQYTRLVREELDSLRQERWNNYLSELDPADPALWKTQKILRTTRRPFPPIHGERGLVYTKQDKAEAFADSLEMQRCYSETPGNDHVTFGGENIPWTDSVKYLGVTMDRSLTWRMHIESTVAKGKACFRKLYPMIARDSQLDLRNKLLLIRQVIQAQLTYASTAWGYAANTHLKRLQTVENTALRCAVNAPRYVRNADIIRDLQYTTTTDTIKDRATKLYAKIDEHHNPLVRAASDYDPGGQHRHRRPRMQLNR